MTSLVCDNSGCSHCLTTTTHGMHSSHPAEPTFGHSMSCCVDCSIRVQADLRQVRSLKRISAFMDELFLVVGRTTSLKTLTGARTTTQGVLELSVRIKQRADESSFDPTLTTSGERDAMVSHNACRVLLRYYAGIIALLFKALEFPLKTREINVRQVQAVQAIILTTPNSPEHSKVAPIHTMLEITPKRPFLPNEYPGLSQLLGTRGVYMDITRRQYGDVPSLAPVSTYPALEISSGQLAPEVIGATYHDHLRQIRHGIQDPQKPLVECLEAEAIIRTVNNAFYRHFVVNGGHAIFSHFDDKAHESTVSKIIEHVKEDVEHLMQFCWVGNWMGIPQAKVESMHKDIVRSCEGKGHTMITAVLEETSGLQLASLEEIS
ncbi:hypothetical protein HBH56_072760 [Parastagonospora nodorum]|nr:hypothetical protein HBH56_072760 [Parastagonospora nodorum]KAH3927404.1 hypothetical protein HBH54_153000 [Parastagonospora nodorum]KAH4139074.1 hypothetical protein HBH45_102000 [Parastagonospora nodorum]KAH4166719.1 hypothetical protein HBH44_063160 [Parastagonospora nodorum]KAH4173983.1 hypothetical protein HBH43_085610 [Parastagonospora nodorum]